MGTNEPQDTPTVDPIPVTATDAALREREFARDVAGTVYDVTVKGGLVKIGWSSRFGWLTGAAMFIPPVVNWIASSDMSEPLQALFVGLGGALIGLTNSMRQLQAR